MKLAKKQAGISFIKWHIFGYLLLLFSFLCFVFSYKIKYCHDWASSFLLNFGSGLFAGFIIYVGGNIRQLIFERLRKDFENTELILRELKIVGDAQHYSHSIMKEYGFNNYDLLNKAIAALFNVHSLLIWHFKVKGKKLEAEIGIHVVDFYFRNQEYLHNANKITPDDHDSSSELLCKITDDNKKLFQYFETRYRVLLQKMKMSNKTVF